MEGFRWVDEEGGLALVSVVNSTVWARIRVGEDITLTFYKSMIDVRRSIGSVEEAKLLANEIMEFETIKAMASVEEEMIKLRVEKMRLEGRMKEIENIR